MRAIHFLLGGSLVGLVACTGQVSTNPSPDESATGTGGGIGSSGTATTTTSSSNSSGMTGTGGGAATGDSIAFFDSAYVSSLNPSVYGKLDPATLFLAFDTRGESCGAPFGDGFSENEAYTAVLIGLPTALQAPGTYALSSSQVLTSGSFWEGSPGDGFGGTSVLTGGSIEVVSIDASTVQVSLSGLVASDGGPYAGFDGSHTAVRCP
jgi:hypothetical protein